MGLLFVYLECHRLGKRPVVDEPVCKSVPQSDDASALGTLWPRRHPVQVDRVFDRLGRVLSHRVELSVLFVQDDAVLVVVVIAVLSGRSPDMHRPGQLLVGRVEVELFQGDFELVSCERKKGQFWCVIGL